MGDTDINPVSDDEQRRLAQETSRWMETGQINLAKNNARNSMPLAWQQILGDKNTAALEQQAETLNFVNPEEVVKQAIEDCVNAETRSPAFQERILATVSARLIKAANNPPPRDTKPRGR